MRDRRRLRILALLAAALLLFAACGGDDEDAAPTEESPPAGETVPPEEGEDETEAATSIDLEAEDIAFSQDTLQVPAGEEITVEFTNHDSVPHNFAAYQSSDAAEEIFVGEIISGPDQSTTYGFTAPDEPGTYFFRCDVHPDQMTGDLIVV